jgi:hypothetical protein
MAVMEEVVPGGCTHAACVQQHFGGSVAVRYPNGSWLEVASQGCSSVFSIMHINLG